MNTIIAGNWKMNGTRADAAALARGIAEGWTPRAGVELVVFPPSPHLFEVASCLEGSDVACGGQHMHAADSGAFTGEVSPPMLRDAGCTHVLLGHSERRQFFGETDAALHRKVVAAGAHGLRPVLCVGESEAEEADGLTEAVLDAQLRGALEGLDAVPGLRVAYEPVWAIGTGKTATPDTIAANHAFIRGRLGTVLGTAGAGVPILYGGSVKPGNATEILSVRDVNGVLVGGASLEAGSFLGIAAGAPTAS